MSKDESHVANQREVTGMTQVAGLLAMDRPGQCLAGPEIDSAPESVGPYYKVDVVRHYDHIERIHDACGENFWRVAESDAWFRGIPRLTGQIGSPQYLAVAKWIGVVWCKD